MPIRASEAFETVERVKLNLGTRTTTYLNSVVGGIQGAERAVSEAERARIYTERAAQHRKTLMALSAPLVLFGVIGRTPATFAGASLGSLVPWQQLVVLLSWVGVVVYFWLAFRASAGVEEAEWEDSYESASADYQSNLARLSEEAEQEQVLRLVEQEFTKRTPEKVGLAIKVLADLSALLDRVPTKGASSVRLMEQYAPWVVFAAGMLAATRLVIDQVALLLTS